MHIKLEEKSNSVLVNVVLALISRLSPHLGLGCGVAPDVGVGDLWKASLGLGEGSRRREQSLSIDISAKRAR